MRVLAAVIALVLLLLAVLFFLPQTARERSPAPGAGEGEPAPDAPAPASAPQTPEGAAAATTRATLGTAVEPPPGLGRSVFHGTTRGPHGQPIPGVEVVLLDRDDAGGALASRGSGLSDAEGRFRIEGVEEFAKIEAQKPGYALLHAPEPRRRGDGWEPCELVLASVGELRVLVSGPGGEPVPEIDVLVSVSAVERYGRRRALGGGSIARHARTDAAGQALFPDIWAEQRLQVVLVAEQMRLIAFERVLEGWAIDLTSEADGEPLFVAPGEAREVRVELAVVGLRITGVVREADGRAFPEPWVAVRSSDVARNAPGFLQRSVRGDGAGTFALELCSVQPLGRVLVTASEEQLVDHPSGAESQRAAWAELDLSGRSTGEEALTLVLQPTLAIAGRVSAEIEGLSAAVRAHPRSDSLPYGELRTLPAGFWAQVYTRKDGAFRLPGLAPGRYDLEVIPNKRLPVTWVSDVAAGREDLAIQVGGTRPVRVSVEVVLPTGEAAETIVATCELRPHGEPPDVLELPAEAIYREPFGWPEWVVSLWSGAGNTTDERGSSMASLLAVRENPTTLELQEGFYWIGAKARDRGGNHTFPIGTGLVELRAGEHRLRFELVPGASLEGRLLGLPPDIELFVALASAGGRLVPVDSGRDELRPLCELGADGSFRLPLVPAGELELRVGTRAELLGGRWRGRTTLQLAPGEERVLELEL